MQLGNVLHFHNRHMVQCKRCKSFIASFETTRHYSERDVRQYRCLVCKHKFTCCARPKIPVVIKRSQKHYY